MKGILLLILIGITTHCGLEKASNKQQHSLENQCHCKCFKYSSEEIEYLNISPKYWAWGGGIWVCR